MSISLGPLPRPTTDAALSSRLSTALTAALAPLAQGLGRTRIEATLSGEDITALDVDLTGVTIPHLDLRGGAQDSALPTFSATPEEGSETTGVLRDLRVAASPLDAVGAPVTFAANVSDLPILWGQSRGESLLGLAEPPADTPVVGAVHVEVPVTGLEVAAKQLLTEAVGEMAVIRSVDLTVTSPRPNTLSVNMAAQAKKSLFSAVIMATATLTIDRAMVATISGLTLHSPNPVFSAALRLMSAKVSALEGLRLPLNTLLPGLHAKDLQVTGGQTLTVDATFG